jgi:2,4-dienoyl-CoA reductase-like NADH-dependent reductase (Old Yellow Enzyme family)
MNTNYKALFRDWMLPCGLTLPNRLAVAPMTTWSGNADATISEEEKHYIRRRSAHVGMFITAACYVIPEGKAFQDQWGCHTDAMLPSLASVADIIHEQGSKAILQIHHGGRMSPASLLGHAPVSASAVPALRPDADVPVAMSEEDIQATIMAFGDATRRAYQAGYDGVELHGANTYLIQQFFSPHSNRRDDEWGGSLEKRLRFPLAVADAAVNAVRYPARPFAIGYRLSPDEVEEPGITIEDTLVLVSALAERKLDWLHISTRDYKHGSLRVASQTGGDASHGLRPTRIIIDHLKGAVPVIGVGRVYTPDDAMYILNDGCACVGLGRILLMEPEWMEKVLAGKEDTIRRTLPKSNGAELLTMPGPMYARLLNVHGWLPLGEE